MSRKLNWSNKQVLEFIELYKNESVLWDLSNPRNSEDCAMAWNRIRSHTTFKRCCVKDLKKKKESLMSTFRLHKYKKRTCPNYRTGWFAFAALESFLGPKYEFEGSNQLEEDSSSEDEQLIESDASNDHETLLITTDSVPSPNETALITSESISIPSEEKNIASCMPQPSKPQKTLTLTLQANNKSETNSLQVKKRASMEETDEYDLYCQLLAKKLKKLNEHQRDLAMHEIDEIMYRVKMQNGQEYTAEQSYITSPTQFTPKPQLIVVQNSTPYGDENVVYQDFDVQPQHFCS